MKIVLDTYGVLYWSSEKMDTAIDDDIIYADLDLSTEGSVSNPSEDKSVYTDISVFQPEPVKEGQELHINVNKEVEMTSVEAPQSTESSPPVIDNNRKL